MASGLSGAGRCGRLRKRTEFLSVAGTRRKWVAPGIIVQVMARESQGAENQAEPPVRLGLTASKKVGNAVQRNRARRRLRALAHEILAAQAVPGHDIVLIARAATVTRPFADLRADLLVGLKRLGLLRGKEGGKPCGP